MNGVLLIRHAQAAVNVDRSSVGVDNAAMGNTLSPITAKGELQSVELASVLESEYGIVPAQYENPVAASEYLRPQQTADTAGFKRIHILPILNESEITEDITPLIGGRKIIEKHKQERWVPDEVMERAERFIELVRTGELDYKIYFSHGLFIAGVKLAAERLLPNNTYEFDDKRGYIPLQTGITKLQTR